MRTSHRLPRPKSFTFRALTAWLVFVLTGHRNYFRSVIPYVWGLALLLVYTSAYALTWLVLHGWYLIHTQPSLLP